MENVQIFHKNPPKKTILQKTPHRIHLQPSQGLTFKLPTKTVIFWFKIPRVRQEILKFDLCQVDAFDQPLASACPCRIWGQWSPGSIETEGAKRKPPRILGDVILQGCNGRDNSWWHSHIQLEPTRVYWDHINQSSCLVWGTGRYKFLPWSKWRVWFEAFKISVTNHDHLYLYGAGKLHL